VAAVALGVSSSWTLLGFLSPLGISFHFFCGVGSVKCQNCVKLFTMTCALTSLEPGKLSHKYVVRYIDENCWGNLRLS
jgi:hypothetical protein